MKAFLPIVLLFFLFVSCSIIKDDDITTQDDFDTKLVIDQIQYNDLIFGPDFNSQADFTYSSAGKLDLIFWSNTSGNFNEESAGGRSGKLRFNVIQSNSCCPPGGLTVVSKYSYDGSGRIASIVNAIADGTASGTTFQEFIYSYNTSGKLLKIESRNNQNEEVGVFTGVKTTTFDSLIYSAGRITAVSRKIVTPTTTTQQTFAITYSNIGAVFRVVDGNLDYENNCASFDTNSYCLHASSPGGGNALIRYGAGGKPKQFTFMDQRFEDDGSTGDFGDQTGRPPDYFFVSPYTITPDLFENGRELAQIFIGDWWKIGVGSNSMFEVLANETVTFNISYEILK